MSNQASIGIYPSTIRINAVTGADVKAPFILVNNSKSQIDMSLSLKAFRASTSNDGSIEYYSDDDVPDKDNLFLKSVFIKDADNSIKKINLYPKESKQLDLSFLVTEKESTEYIFSVVAVIETKKIDSDETSIVINPGVAMNIIATVNSSTLPDISISEFTSSKIFLGGPVPFQLNVSNTGDISAEVSGTVTIFDTLGRNVGEVKLIPSTVLKDSQRKLNSEGTNLKWNEKFLLGYYTAEVKLSINEQKNIYSETHFIAIPLFALIIISLIFILLLSLSHRILKKLNFKRT